MEDIDSLRKFLDYPKDIVIFSHRNPDGDAIGSSMGLKLYLENYGHRVDIVFPSEFPSILTFLPKTDDIVIFDFEKERVQNIIDKCEMMFFLDFSSLDRVDNIGTLIIEKNVPKVHIDHHLDPEPIADYVLSDSEASSTSELVYRFFELFDNAKYINSKVAECLMTGIISDTGSFRYSVTPETFRVSSELMKTGLDLTSLQNHIYNSYSEKQLRLVGYVIHNKLEIIPEYKTAIMSLSKQDYKDFNIQREILKDWLIIC
ncbi:MAG: DHH family phosphoesterase [Saprospiraceae bacterium]